MAFLVYLPSVRYGFVWDDKALIAENRYLAEANVGQVFSRNYWYNPDLPATVNDQGYYRPLSTLTFLANRRMSGLNPAPYHLTNIILHGLVTFLVCLVLFRLFGEPSDSTQRHRDTKGEISKEQNTEIPKENSASHRPQATRNPGTPGPLSPALWLAALGGLFFGLNPALSSSVVWISGRNYLLAMLFLLLSFYALLRGNRSSFIVHRSSSNAGAWRLLFAGSFLLAMLAHETSIVFLLIALGWILAVGGRRHAAGGGRCWLLAAVLPVVAYLVLRLGVARVGFVPGALHDIISQPLVALNSFGQEMLVLFVPFSQKVMYAAIPGFSGYSLPGILFLGLPLYAIIRQRSRKPQAASRKQVWLGYAWMVLFLLPFANLTSWGPSGRMLYISGLGSLVVLGAVCGRRCAAGGKTVASVLAVLYCVALGAWTLKRSPIWKDEVTLYHATVREAPESQCAHLYQADSLETAGQLDAAVLEYRAAITADPDLVGAHYKLANILYDRNDMPGAIEEYREVVRLNASALAHRCLAQAYTRAGLPDSAAVELREVVRREPQVGGAHTELALNLAQRGRNDSALAEFKLAAQLDSGSADAHNNLGLSFEQAGLPDSAIREYRASLAIDPSSALTLNNLGSALLAAGDARAAIKAFQQALVLDPDFAPARDGLNRASGKK